MPSTPSKLERLKTVLGPNRVFPSRATDSYDNGRGIGTEGRGVDAVRPRPAQT